MSAMDREYVASLVDFAKSVNLEEVVWEQGDQKIAFKRRMAPPAPPPAPAAPKAAAKPEAPKSHFILSPMVGTFLRAPKDRPPLVVEGDEITAGEKLAVVEAMKVPKDVISDANGRILKILVENGKPVEYGQKLFEVERATRQSDKE